MAPPSCPTVLPLLVGLVLSLLHQWWTMLLPLVLPLPGLLDVTVGDAWPMLSDHCPLMLSLALPGPLATPVSALPTLQAYWEPGA